MFLSTTIFFAPLVPSLAHAQPENAPEHVEKVDPTVQVSLCERVLTKTKAIAKKPFTWAKNGWLEFRAEVKEQGKIRYVLAPRHRPEKFSLFAAFVDPLLDLPIESYSFVKHRVFGKAPVQKRLSAFTALPVGMLAWTMLFATGDYYATKLSVESVETAVAQQRFGSEYVAEWMLSGAITPVQAIKILRESDSAFYQDLAPIHQRVNQFKDLILWKPEQADQVHKILDSIEQKFKPHELVKKSGLAGELTKNSAFIAVAEELPATVRFTVELLTQPTVQFLGHPDTYWLSLFFDSSRREDLTTEQKSGLSSIDQLYRYHAKDLSISTLAYMVAQTLGDKKLIAAKVKKAKDQNFNLGFNFLYRADMPVFSGESIFNDLSGDLKIEDEIDLWKLIFTDPRFASFRKRYEAQSESEFTLLLETQLHAKALSQVHILAREYKLQLPNEQVCPLIYGTATSNPNPLFGGLKDLMPASTALQGLNWAKFEIANLYYQAFVNVSATKDETQQTLIFDHAFALEKAVITQALSDGGAALSQKYSGTIRPSCF